MTQQLDEKKRAGRAVGIEDMDDLQKSLYRYCLSMTGSEWEAQDLSQETWLKALDVMSRLKHTNPEALLITIARNKWIDHCRRSAVFKGKLARLASVSDQNSYVSDHIGSLEMERAFQSLLQHLTPQQCSVFLLREVLGYSIEETAQLLDKSGGAVKAALHRARESLHKVRERLRDEEGWPIENEERQRLLRELVQAYERGDTFALIGLIYRSSSSDYTVSAIGSRMPATMSLSGANPHISGGGTLQMSA
ncbi:RNA polymerase sigma factor [Paenibacillus sp. J5C_2022]|uniref:RNA polymerase sigma factor n=1 Tax=Paenibacillus sp. J5C2022 TaxID=2977129 RepID=UPI0021D27A2D|nr:RNA polymerase sigma factor [Paenibacillus sp. J5C2022]MCU6713119.1 RNA polymerase sigma factor [Paenibacillus sp. J5C2022]